MGITRILATCNVRIKGRTYDVLIPLPANHDACMMAIGIEDFDDADDDWDRDFLTILQALVGPASCSIDRIDRATSLRTKEEGATLSDIHDILAWSDNDNIEIAVPGRSITFTRGHAIF